MSDDIESLRVAQRLRLVTDRLRRVVRQAGRAEGLSRSEEATLSRLERSGPLTTAQLADRERVRPQTMGAVVRELVDRGLAEKHPDPDDRRREQVRITAAGLQEMRRINALRDRELAELIERDLTPEQRTALAEGLALLEGLGNRA